MNRRKFLQTILASPLIAAVHAAQPRLRGFDPKLIELIRRPLPNYIAYDVMGVSPVTGPVGLTFNVKYRYDTRKSFRV